MFSSSSRSSRGSTSAPQSKPALRNDKRNKRRLLTPQVLAILLCVFSGCSLVVLVLTRLHHNNNNNNNYDLNKVLKEIISSNQQSEQHNQQAAANAIPHNRNSSSSSGSSTMTSSAPLTASVVLQRSLPPSVKVHLLSHTRPLKSCPHTIVTAYFQLRSKYTADKYIQWMTNMLSIQDCVVIITSGGANLVETMKRLRQHALDATVILELPNDVNDLPISQLQANTNTYPEFWPHQLDMDREKKRHKSHQLFWIWLSKTWCVVQAIQQDYFHSNFYMWQDIGAFRDTNYNGKMIIQHPEVVPNGTLLWMAHHPPNPPPSGPIWNDKWQEKVHYFHSGSQAAGHKDVWLEYHARFAEVMDQFVERNMFIGEDQCVLQGTCQKYPDLCAYIPATDVKDNHYFGLRYALHHGIKTKPWQMPGAKAQTSGR